MEKVDKSNPSAQFDITSIRYDLPLPRYGKSPKRGPAGVSNARCNFKTKSHRYTIYIFEISAKNFRDAVSSFFNFKSGEIMKRPSGYVIESGKSIDRINSSKLELLHPVQSNSIPTIENRCTILI